MSWHCVACGMPQFTSSFFDSIDVHTNSFSNLDSSGFADVLGPPNACSSPKVTVNNNKSETSCHIISWDNLVILNVNFQSIKNKKAELLNIIDSYNPSVLIGTETWLNESIHSSETFPPNNCVNRKDRSDGFGGVLVAVRSGIVCDRINEHITTEAVYTSLTLEKTKQLIIGAIYRPPSSDLDYMESICRDLEATVDSHKKSVIWVGGDLNLPDINWSSQSVEGNANAVAINQRFLGCIHHCASEHIVDFPTRLGATLDLFMTNRPSLVDKCRPAPGVRDHDIVYVTSSASVRRSKPVQHKIYLWNKADLDTMKGSAVLLRPSFLRILIHLAQLRKSGVPSKTSS